MKASRFEASVNHRSTLSILAATLLAACNQSAAPDNEELDVQPATLEAAAATAAHIGRLQKADPNDPRALDAIHRMQPRLDQLNHLVARVELEPGHAVSFYETAPGVIGVTERGHRGQARALLPEDVGADPLETFARLAKGAAAPAPLAAAAERRAEVTVPFDDPAVTALRAGEGSHAELSSLDAPMSTDGVTRASSALTAADGQWFAQNGCMQHGDFHLCMPNVSGNVFADFNTKTSFWTVAPFAGSTVFVQLQYNNTQQGFIDPVFVGDWEFFQWFSGRHKTCCGLCVCASKDYDVARHRWDLINGASSSFHWSFAARWNCLDHDCESWPW
jgi:hypothetical protein